MAERLDVRETIVVVHGIWHKESDFVLLRQRLKRSGYAVKQFRYPSVRYSVQQNAARLQRFLHRVEGDVVHFVAHSLGGLVVRQLFHDFPQQRPGRIVTLGSPHQGSAVARTLHRHTYGRWLVGRSVEGGLAGDVPSWQAEHDIGVIAGTMGLGVGWLVAPLSGPNDGTVTLTEAQLDSATDYITLPCSHIGLLFSTSVTRQICAFLENGRFVHS